MSDDDRDVVDISTDDPVGSARSEQKKTKQERMAEQNKEMLTQRISALDHTIDRIEEADEDEIVLQELEGNVLVEVPVENREELREKLVRTRTELEEQREETTQVLTGN